MEKIKKLRNVNHIKIMILKLRKYDIILSFLTSLLFEEHEHLIVLSPSLSTKL
jgi:hypothetical protein